MGSSLSNQQARTVNMKQLIYIRHSHIGAHYFNKQSNQEYLLISQNTGACNGTSSAPTTLHQILETRLTKKRRNIPQILSFSDTNANNLCNISPSINIWMLHPSRSLDEEIKHREEMRLGFEEGEILMVVYGVVSACIGYEGLGLSVGVVPANIYIAENGDIVLSDAFLYLNAESMIRSRFVNPSINISRVRDITIKLISTFSQNCNSYSLEFIEFVNLLKDGQFTSYRKINEYILYVKAKMQHQSQCQHAKEDSIKSVNQTFINQLRDSRNLTPFTNVDNNINNISNEKPTASQKTNNKPNYKLVPLPRFNRTAPLNQNHQNYVEQVHATQPTPTTQKLWTQQDLSSITASQLIKTIPSQQHCAHQNQAENTINMLFGSQREQVEVQTRLLWQKNNQVLQNLIYKEKNIILQVPESEYEGSSVEPSRMSRTSKFTSSRVQMGSNEVFNWNSTLGLV